MNIKNRKYDVFTVPSADRGWLLDLVDDFLWDVVDDREICASGFLVDQMCLTVIEKSYNQ